tara:strand:- start:1095 stop:2789 length:1695 start_codon:yes stop_codon:yes gene_type:complete
MNLFGGGGGGGGGPSFTQGNYTRLDPASQQRRDHLFNQAQQYVATNPFSQRYGGNVTGMTPMGQAAQQFMTGRFLGPNAYQAQNLGFQNYQPSFTYTPMGGGQQAPFQPQPFVPEQAPQSSPEQVQQFQQQNAQQQRNFGAEGSPDDMIMVGGALDRSFRDDTPVRPKSGDGSQMYGGGPRFEGGGDIGMGQGFADSGERDRPSRQKQMPSQNIGFGRPDIGRGAGETDADFMPGGRYEGTGGPGLEGPAVLKASPQPSISDMRFRGPVRQDPKENPALGVGGLYQAPPMQQTPQQQFQPPPQMPQAVQPPPQPDMAPIPQQPFTPASIGGIESVLNQEGPTVQAATTLGRPEGQGIEAYMDAAGVDAQIDQAQQDYEQQLNALQAQQAGSGAFGSRAQLQDLGALEGNLRQRAQIRAAGFDKAAQRMEADVARQQQAAIEQGRLGQGLRGQQLAAAQALGQEERAIGSTLAGMGDDQRRIMEEQRIFDEQQWRNTMQGPGRELAFLQGYLPPDVQQQMVRDPSGTQKALSLAGGIGSILGGPVGGLLGRGFSALFGGGGKGKP